MHRQSSLASLLKRNLILCLLIFLLLQVWRPCFFLTDDNLSALFPIFTEMGRHLWHGESPFVVHYIFGGRYDLSRDIGAPFWHPFYLVSLLLAGTWAHFWIVDAIALWFLLLTTAGFTILAFSLAREFNPELPDSYLIFFTMSYVFSTYVLTIGSSWLQFLGNQSALPWLALGILHRKVIWGTLLISLFTIHEIMGAFAASTVLNGVILTLFAAGVALLRKSPGPFFAWAMGNFLALLLTVPYLLLILDGFAHAARMAGLSLEDLSQYSIPPLTAPFSFFLGNWTQLLITWAGDPSLQSMDFPYLSTIAACAAAWCIVPALLGSPRWTGLEILTLALAAVMAVLVLRPPGITIAMHHLPFFKSMRWPFRECMQALFFFHLFLVLRPAGRTLRLRAPVALFSLAIFVLPMPFSRIPTLNSLFLDRAAVFSGRGEIFWNGIKARFKPTDEIATLVPLPIWNTQGRKIPYTYLCTANFPVLYRVRCISGYSPTAPLDEVPLKTRPGYLFGAFRTDQKKEILAEKSDLILIQLECVEPLKITLYSKGKTVDITPPVN